MTSKTNFLFVILCVFPVLLSAQICMPSLTVHNGVSAEVHPVDNNGDGMTVLAGVVLRLDDLILRADDYCNAGPLSFSMRKSGTGSGFPLNPDGTPTSSLQYTCTELGTQLVEVWVRNNMGITNYSETYIIVQDNTGECFPHTPQPASCNPDVLFPEIHTINGLSGALRASPDGPALLSVPVSALVRNVYDNCGGPYEYRLRKSGTGTGVPADSIVVFNCDEQGAQILEVWAGDPAGNWNYSETYVIVQDPDLRCASGQTTPPPAGCSPDKTPPDLLVYNGFSQGVVWSGNGPSVRVFAEDFIRLGRDRCHNRLGWRISKWDWQQDNLPSKPPKSASSSISFSCEELGTQLVYVWLRDGAGNWARAETYVIVQDNIGACGQGSGLQQVVVPEFKQEILARLGGTPVQATPRLSQAATMPAQLVVWPNPATDGFTLRSRLEQSGTVQIFLYDQVGRVVRVLAEQWMEAGDFQAQFSRDNLPSGLYRCVLQSREGVQSVAVVFR